MNSEVRLLPTVGALTSKTGGSSPVVARAETAVSGSQVLTNEVVVGNPGTLACAPETKNAVSEVSVAATALARRPRMRKKWSGWIGSTRSYCGMPIRLSTGEEVFAFGALRGRVVWSRQPGVLADRIHAVGVDWGVVPASAVEIVRNPHAVLLGRLKAGTAERRSALKAASSRRNGAMPTRRGRRGRPPRIPRLAETAGGYS